MERLAYLWLSVSVFLVWCGIFAYRPYLRRTLLKAGALGAILGPVSEFWYFADYWRPPSLFGVAVYSFEDVLFGFAMMGIAVTVYDAVFRTKDAGRLRPQRRKIYLVLAALGIGGMVVFNNLLGINSVFVSAGLWIVLALLMIARRRDLLLVSLLSGLFCTLIILPVYVVLFGFLVPQFIEKYWLLYGTPVGWIPAPGLPWTEVLWYFTLGMFAGIVLPYARGTKKETVFRLR